MEEQKRDIRNIPESELDEFLASLKQPNFRLNQIKEWLWQKGAHGFNEMTNLPISLRQALHLHFEIRHGEIYEFQKSSDGTIKNAVKLYDGQVVESVLIPTSKRITACVSSQVGCSLDCHFCATARLKRMRNLKADEIFDQVVLIDKQAQSLFGRPLSNIVFMGMGEPLLNYQSVIEAVEKITQKDAGFGMAARRITISTSGIAKMIAKLADEQPKFKLALSLHSAVNSKRSSIMPINISNPLELLMESLRYWYKKTKSQVTFEYVVWKGFNDQEEDIQALKLYCRKVPSKVNLIQYNSIGDERFIQADNEVVERYRSILEDDGTVVKIRKSRGIDIDAACGQLANKNSLIQTIKI